MADETYDSLNIGDIRAEGSTSKNGTVKVGEALAPGDPIRVDDGVAYPTKDSDKIFTGVAASKDGHDNDVDFDVGEEIEYYPSGQDTSVHMKIKPAAGPISVKEGQIAVLSDTDDQLKLFAWNVGADITASLMNKVGKFAQAHAGHATEIRILKIDLRG